MNNVKYKNLLILGASGGIGQWVVKIAKERGYSVTILVRSKTSFDKAEGLNVIEGNVLDSNVLEKVIQGQDAVLSCLGIKRKSKANPWSAIVSPSNLTEVVAKTTVEAMKRHGVQRLIVISAAGVGDSWKNVSSFMKFIIRSSSIKLSYNDLDNMEKILQSSDIDSLAIRPVGLVDGQPSNRAKIVSHFKVSSKISKGDVAKWMLDSLEKETRFSSSSEMIGWD